MAQVAGGPPAAAGPRPPPQPGMGPPPPQQPRMPHAAAALDPGRHRQQQQRHHQHKQRPPGSSSGSRPPHKPSGHKPSSRPGGSSGSGGGGGSGAEAPALVPAIAADGSAELDRLRRDTPFICHPRFKNDLPEIPADPKVLVSRFEPDRLSRFFLTGIEQQPRRELLLPADAGVTISLMDLERFDVPPGPPARLDPADEALLQDVDNLPSAGAAASPLKVKRATKGQVSWLMATTYLTSSQEGVPGARRAGGAAAAAAGAGRFQMGEAQEPQQLTREQQLADIEGTFAAAAAPPRHPSKPGVTAVSSVPVLPDFGSWADKFVVVNFEDGDPAQDSRTLSQVPTPELRSQLVSRCMIKSYQPQSGSEPAMGLLVPRAAAAAAARGEPLPDGCGAEDLEGAYSWDCEYSFELMTRELHKPVDALLLCMHDDHVGYCQFDGQLKLKKRRRQEGDEPRPEKACIYTREFRPAELQERANRQAELEAYDPALEEEEEEEGLGVGGDPGGDGGY